MYKRQVDASKGMVGWAKENARSSGLGEAPIRWIVDDCVKFVEREIRRGNHYDGIIMDPPSYGRGPVSYTHLSFSRRPSVLAGRPVYTCGSI